LAEYPALLSWQGQDWDSKGGLLGIVTGAYGDAGDPERERWFTRAASAELLIDAGAVVTPSVEVFVMQQVTRAIHDRDLTAFLNGLQREPWLLWRSLRGVSGWAHWDRQR
jgi:hypothetical protein